jgi:arylsulfatase A-like enzyme
LLGEGRDFEKFSAPARSRARWSWVEAALEREWEQVSDEGSETVALRSPELGVPVRSIDAVRVRGHSSSTGSFSLGWAETGRDSRAELAGRRWIVEIGGPGEFVQDVQGERLASLWEQFHGHRPRVEHLFLEYPRDSSVQIGGVEVHLRTPSSLAGQQAGEWHEQDGEYRRVATVSLPGRWQWGGRLPRGARLKLGVALAGRQRCSVTLMAASGGEQRTLWQGTVAEAGGWQDVDVDLTDLEGREVELSLGSDAPGGVLVVSDPVLLRMETDEAPSVVLYLVDALRRDHLGLYGYPIRTSPFLDSVAVHSVVVEECYSQAPWTKPSVVSMMTSVSPLEHLVGAVTFTDQLSDSALTLAEVFSREGYITACFAVSPYSSFLSNVQQGFDYVFSPAAFSVRDRSRKDEVPHSDDINRLLLPWVRQHAHERVFVYVHSLDPHYPYSAPEAPDHLNVRRLNEDMRRRHADLLDAHRAQENIPYRAWLSGPLGRTVRASAAALRLVRVVEYDAEVYFNDGQIARLWRELEALGTASQTLLVVTSDHGEEFGEHGVYGHGHSVYHAGIAVPLILHWAGHLPARRVDATVGLVDLAPTVLSVCGIGVPSGMKGSDLTELWRGSMTPPAGALSVRTNPLYHTPESQLLQETIGPEQYALVRGQWKLIWNTLMDTWELYDLGSDPLERRNLVAAEPRVLEEMREMLREEQRLSAGADARATAGAPLSGQDRRMLEALGYLTTDSTTAEVSAPESR